MARVKTRKQKERAQEHRLQHKAQYSYVPLSSSGKERTIKPATKNIIHFERNLIFQDLMKTIVVSAIILVLLLIIWKRQLI